MWRQANPWTLPLLYEPSKTQLMTMACVIASPYSTPVSYAPSRTQLMNMAGVVAGPKRATLAPFVAMPAAMAGARTGPDKRGSLPT